MRPHPRASPLGKAQPSSSEDPGHPQSGHTPSLALGAPPTPPIRPHRKGAPSRESAGSRHCARPLRPHLSRRLAMNSGMETVSISTKSAFPNSRLSCSAMAPAHGLRWARTGSGGRARAAGARGELGRGRGGARGRGRRGGSAGRRPPRCSSARSRPARLTRQFPLFPRRLPGAVGEETTRRRRRRLVPPLALSGPGPAAARPTRPGPASPPRPAPPGRGAAPAAKATTSSPGRRARAGRPAGARSGPGGGGGVAAPSGDRRWELRGAVPRRANVGGGWNQVSRIAASARAWYMPTKLRKCLVELLAWIIHYDSVTLLRSPLLLFCSHPLRS